MNTLKQKQDKSKRDASSHFVIPRTIDGRVSGYVKVGNYDLATKTFTKPVRRERHFMRHANGYGLQLEVFDKLKNEGANKVRIIETDTGDIFNSDLSDWVQHGKVADFGYGKQIFLSEKYMYKRSPLVGFETLGGVQNVPNYQKQPDSHLVET